MSSPQNDNFQVRAPKPIESKIMDFAGGASTPYANIAAANAAILSAYRWKYLTIWAFAANGDPLEYWWKNDLLDASLEPKNKDSVTLTTDGSIALLPGYNYQDIIVIPTSGLSALKIGTSSGAGDLEPGAAVTGGASYKLASTLGYITTSTNIFFSGITSNSKVLIYKKF